MCVVLRRGSDLPLLLCTKTITSLAPPQKQDSTLGVGAQWERHVAAVEALLFLAKNKVTVLKSSPSSESHR